MWTDWRQTPAIPADPDAVDDIYTFDLVDGQTLDVEATVTTETLDTTVLDEDFSGGFNLENLDAVAESDLIGWRDGAVSNSLSDGTLLFEPVDVSTLDSGTLSFFVETEGRNPRGFEGPGSPFADFVRVEISVDGGAFQLLDQFEVDPDDLGLPGDHQTFVGSQTGQTFGAAGSTLAYDLPAGAGSVQLRLITELTAPNEIVRFDDVKIGGEQTVETGYATGLLGNDTDGYGDGLMIVSAEGETLLEMTAQQDTVLAEDFDGAPRNLEDLDTVDDSDLIGNDGAAQANKWHDGALEFETVNIAGLDNETLSFSLNADLSGHDRFGGGGRARDFVMVQVRFDDGSYQTVDVFDVEWQNGEQVFVSQQSGQEVAVADGFVALSYDLSALAGYAETAQVRLIAETNAPTGVFEVDDLSLVGTETVFTGDGVAAINLASGAIVTVYSDGTFHYDANGAFDYLAEGEEATDTFTYTVADAVGRTDTATATVKLVGTNEAPVAVVDTAAATEDGPVVTGSVATNDSDVDNNAALSFSLNAPVAGLTLDPDGGYTFDPSDQAYQSLNQGEDIKVVADYTVTDQFNASDQSTLTITLTGTDDAAVITGTFTGDVSEGDIGDTETVSGAIAVSDVDADDNPTFANATANGSYGAIAVNPAGDTWTYTLDQSTVQYLDAGDTVTDTLTLTDSEGNSQDIVITITGTDDAAIVTGTVIVGAVTEGDIGDTETVSGAIAVSDVDEDDNPTVANASANGAYGSIVVNAAGDTWTYTLDQSTVQYLDTGDTVTDSLMLTDSEGNIQHIAITITGTDDAAVITGTFTGGVNEGDIGDTETVSGAIAVFDVDADDNPTFANATATGAYGAIAVNAAGDTWTYTLDQSTVQGLDAGDTVTDTLTLSDSEGNTQDIVITITGTDDAAVFTGTFDLADLDGTNGFVIDGGNATTDLGISVSNAGDVDNDGFDDIIVGTQQVSEGHSFVIYGGANIGSSGRIAVNSLDGSFGSELTADKVQFTAGIAVSGGGDLNGDGIDDIAMTAAPLLNQDPNPAYVTAFFGLNGGFGDTLDANDTTEVQVFGPPSVEVDETFGTALDLGGDINGDGIDDIVVGMPLYLETSTIPKGATFVFFGSTSFNSNNQLSADDLDGTNGFRLTPQSNGTEVGASVDSRGDFNADGYADILIGAPGAPDGGTVYLVYGGDDVGSSGTFDLDNSGANSIAFTGSSGDRAGQAVSFAGDINGDHVDDILIGAPEDGDAGAIYVVYGNEFLNKDVQLSSIGGTSGFVINGIDAGDHAGYSVSGAGDVNGDGIGDIIIGSFKDGTSPGEAYVVFGVDGTREDLDLSSLDGSNGFVINGINPGDRVGWDVSDAGDINGDGFDDVIVGARGEILLPDVEETYVVFGRDFNGIVDQLGTEGDDTIDGTEEDEILIGAQGNDTINGNGGDDVLKGANGDDILAGGEGYDTLIGGNGKDTFVFESLDTQTDFVIDFVSGEDVVELRGFGLTFDDLDTNSDGILNDADTDISTSTFFGGSFTIFVDGPTSVLTFQNVSSMSESDLIFS